MPDRSRWWQALLPRRAETKTLATNLDVLRAGQPAKPVQLTPTTSQMEAEHGVAGTQVFGGTIAGEEYNPDLQGQKGMEAFDKMRRSDAQVRASLQAMKLPLLSAVWEAQPPKGGDAVDDAIADFVHNTLFDDDAMQDSWHFVLRHILLQLDFGFSALEKVWRVDDKGNYRLKRLAPRLPRTFRFWHLTRSGEIVRAWQWAPEIKDDRQQTRQQRADAARLPSSQPMPPSVSYRYIAIPGDRLCVFTLDREGDNVEGISMLRSAYKHYWYKDLIYHLDGVRLDRYGVGIPTAELQPEHSLTEEEIDELESVLENLRANERVFLIAPVGVKYRILGPEAGGGASVSAAPIIEHHNTMIARNILAGFLTMGTDPHGTLGFGSRLADLFVSSLYGIASGIAGDLKRSVVKPLCDLNFDMTNRQYPSVVVRDLESADVERLISVLAQGAGATILTPDDGLEQDVRESLRVSPLPDELTRKAKAAAQPQMLPGQVPGQPPPGQPGAPGQPAAGEPPQNQPASLDGLRDLIDVLRAERAATREPIQLTVNAAGGSEKPPRLVTSTVERDDRDLVVKKIDIMELADGTRSVVTTEFERDERGLVTRKTESVQTEGA